MSSQEEIWLLDEKYHGEKSEAFFTDLARLQAGEPLAYLIGSIPFLNCQINLDSKPLIPRPETEYWTEQLIQEVKLSPETAPTLLDLCAGSGAIGIAVGKAIPTAIITFIELEHFHLPTILSNTLLNGIDPMAARILEGDLFKITNNETLGKFDFIASNPPYIDPELADRTETSVKTFEPALALYGGEKGMLLIKKIIKEAPQFLNENGQLWLEHEPEQVSAIYNLAQENFLVTTHNDQYQTPRFTQLVLQ